MGLENPLGGWELNQVKRGIQRKLGRPPKQKLAITPQILKDIYKALDKEKPEAQAFWTACLIGFFGFLRKSTLLPKSSKTTDTAKAIRISDVILEDKSSANIVIRHTKTIQFGQRLLTLPFATVPGSHLCPVNALIVMLSQLNPEAKLASDQPLFSYSVGTNLHHLTHKTFVDILKEVLVSSGKDASQFSGHSFRRGGCSHAFSIGVPAPIIKLRGDWKSNAFERYISISQDHHLDLAKAMALSVHQD